MIVFTTVLNGLNLAFILTTMFLAQAHSGPLDPLEVKKYQKSF